MAILYHIKNKQNNKLTIMSKSPKKSSIKWKKVPGFPTFKISTIGDVVRIKDGYKMTKSFNCGYHAVNLTKNGTTKRYFVHRLVAEAFIPNPKKLPC